MTFIDFKHTPQVPPPPKNHGFQPKGNKTGIKRDGIQQKTAKYPNLIPALIPICNEPE